MILFVLLEAFSWDDRLKLPVHLESARKLLAEVRPADTSYRHKNNQVEWAIAGRGAVCHADCSGFLNALLLHTSGAKADRLEVWFGVKRPLAKHYVSTIRRGVVFKEITQIDAVRPGDFLAIEYPKPNDNTGHVVLICDPPRKQSPSLGPKVDGVEPWLLPIMDSTTSPHGNDSRSNKEGQARPGLGTGVMRLFVDQKGRIQGHSWGVSGRSVYHSASARPIAVGRWVGDVSKKSKDADPTVHREVLFP